MPAAWWGHGWLRTLDSYNFHMLACHHVSMASLPHVCQRIVVAFLRPLQLLVLRESVVDERRSLYSIRLMLAGSLECVAQAALHLPPDLAFHSSFISHAVKVPLRHHLACLHNACVSLFDMSSGRRLWCTRFPATPDAIACMSSQSVIVVAVVGRLYLLDAACGSEHIRIPAPPCFRINCLLSAHLIDRTAEVLLVGCDDDICIVPTSWPLSDRRALDRTASSRPSIAAVLRNQYHGPITNLACAPRGSSIAAGLQNGHLCIVDARTLELLHNVRFGDVSTSCATYLSETQIAVGCDWDLHIVDVGSGARLLCFAIAVGHFPIAVARPPHGESLFVACERRGIYKANLAGFDDTAPIVMRVNDILVKDIFEFC